MVCSRTSPVSDWTFRQLNHQAGHLGPALVWLRAWEAGMQLLTLGDWCVPGHPLHDASRPSDFLLSHLTLFTRRDTAHAATWHATLQATVQVRPQPAPSGHPGLTSIHIHVNASVCKSLPFSCSCAAALQLCTHEASFQARHARIIQTPK